MKVFSSIAAKTITLIAALLLSTAQMQAQCAMCKAVAQDAVDHQAFGVAVGLNTGIIFIMTVPYILLAILLFVFFRKRIKGFLTSFGKIHS